MTDDSELRRGLRGVLPLESVVADLLTLGGSAKTSKGSLDRDSVGRPDGRGLGGPERLGGFLESTSRAGRGTFDLAGIGAGTEAGVGEGTAVTVAVGLIDRFS